MPCTEEKFYPLGTTDEYFEASMKKDCHTSLNTTWLLVHSFRD